MTEYERGFLEKCAEYGIEGETADGMLKQAIFWAEKFRKQDEALREIHNEMLRRARAGGYDQYLPRNVRYNSQPVGKGLFNWIGRSFRRLFHGSRSFADMYRGDMERALDMAQARWQEKYNSASPEVRRLMREEVLQRRRAYDAEELAKARKENPLGGAEIDRLKNKPAAKDETLLTHDQFTRREALKRNFRHNYAHVRFDENTGKWDATGGYGLPHDLARENAAVEQAWEDYQRELKNRQPQKPDEPSDPGKLNAPKATW